MVKTAPISDESWLRREAQLRRFEEAWKVNGSANIDDFLTDVDRTNPDVVIEFVRLDMEYRAKHGQPARLHEYSDRYPGLAQHLSNTLETQNAQAGPSTVADELPAVDGYEIQSEIGRGGMGVVYVARHLALNRLVALKMLKSAYEPRPAQLARLRTEAASIGRLQHPNIVQIHDVGQANGLPYMAMEFVAGTNLTQRLKSGAMPFREAAELIETLARAVHHAHTRGIIHRDLTPGNILLPPNQPSVTAKITDFGLAKILTDDSGEQTQTGTILGTPSYMAPEQAAGHVRLIGPRTDIYGLGAVLFAALTGRPPFQSSSHWQTTRQIIEETPPPVSKFAADVPRDLETICMKCLSKEPHRRYGSAEELADDLRRFLNREPIVARRVGMFERTWLWACRNPALAATAATAFLAVLFTGAIGFAQVLVERNRFRLERDRAEALLYRSLVSDARAQIQARSTGWWWSAMNTLRTASSLQVADRDVLELRDLVGDCLSAEHPCFRLYASWPGHRSRVVATAFNQDGQRAATADGDGLLKVWSIPDGRCLAEFPAHSEPVTALVFDPTGPRLASSSHDGTVRIWDVENPAAGVKPLRAMELNGGRVNGLQYGPDGGALWACCQDGSVFMMAAAGDESPRKLSHESAEAGAIALRPEKSLIAVSVHGKQVQLRDAATGESKLELPLGIRVMSMAFNRRTGGLLAADPDIFGYTTSHLLTPGTVQYFANIHTNGVVKVASIETIGGNRCNLALTASIDGSIRLWNGGKEMARATGDFGPIRSAAVSGDSHWVLAGYLDGQVRLWELAVPLHRIVPPEGGAPIGAFIASSRRYYRHPSIVDFTEPDRATAETPGDMLQKHGDVWGAAVSRDGRWCATAHTKGEVRIWDGESHKLVTTVTVHDGLAWSVAFSPDSQLIASGSGEIQLHSTGDWKLVRKLDVGDALVRALAFHPHRPWLVAAVKDRTLRAWNIHTGEPIGDPVKLDAEIYGLAFRPDGHRLAGGSFDQHVYVWDLPVGDWSAKPTTWRFSGHHAEVWGVAYSPDGQLLASGSERGVILQDGENHARLIRLRGLDGQIRSLSFSADGELLAATPYSKQAVVWRLPLIWRTLSELGL